MKKQLLFLFLVLGFRVSAQQRFELIITFPPNFDTRTIIATYNDGLMYRDLPLTFDKNNAYASGEYYSNTATVEIIDEREDRLQPRGFWISNKATIQFSLTKDGYLKVARLVGASDLTLLGKRYGFNTTEYLNFSNFYDTYSPVRFTGTFTDSLRQVRENLLLKWHQKELQVIQSRAHNYYTFDRFRRGLALSSYLNPNTLLQTFHIFPKAFKESVVGQNLFVYLTGKSLKKGSIAPRYSTIDAYSKAIISNQTDKNVLLVFWASYCGPCIKEFPQLIEFINSYPELVPVFVTIDTNFSKFDDAVKKYNLSSYHHVFGDKKLASQFGINGVPEIYLIGKSCHILYRREEFKDNDLSMLLSLIR